MEVAIYWVRELGGSQVDKCRGSVRLLEGEDWIEILSTLAVGEVFGLEC